MIKSYRMVTEQHAEVRHGAYRPEAWSLPPAHSWDNTSPRPACTWGASLSWCSGSCSLAPVFLYPCSHGDSRETRWETNYLGAEKVDTATLCTQRWIKTSQQPFCDKGTHLSTLLSLLTIMYVIKSTRTFWEEKANNSFIAMFYWNFSDHWSFFNLDR